MTTTNPPVSSESLPSGSTKPPAAQIRTVVLRWPGTPIIALFGAVLVVCTVLRPAFLTAPSLSGFLSIFAPTICLAIGVSFVMLVGSIDLSIGPMMGFANILTVLLGSVGWQLFSAGPSGAAASCSTEGVCTQGLPFGVAATLAIVVTAIFGLLNGILVAVVRLQPLLATLASGFVATGLGLWFFPKPGGRVSPDAVGNYGAPHLLSLPLVAIATIVVVSLVLSKSPLGVLMRAVGSDRTRAYSARIRVSWVTIAAFTTSGVFAGIAGVLFTLSVASADPTVGVTFTLNAIAGAVLGGAALKGGRAEPIGPLFGAATLGLVGVLIDALDIPTYYQQLASGIVIVLALASTARTAQRRKV
ncbi:MULTISPECIES: ABC transporter permease [unclassified Rhodococcus (in: high G+C Gram-positive bacteria)]|uniref:ABC transporter permease n=1 Tax=unclassified Rhodococcus (in: high G+C Gram-positive bacteria) TaxID=192944 RepID=UPI0015C6027F|nr:MULTISPECIES: ABC transporter permease [unclassified Rhodococcus (in: high G+C Gram-positive bacteria)]